MNIKTSTKFQPSIRPKRSSRAKQPKATRFRPIDSFTFSSMRRSTKKKMLKAGITVLGAGLGALAVASYTGDMVGLAAQVAGGIGGGLAGAVVLGAAGIAATSVFSSDNSGFGGIAAAMGGVIVGGAIGGVGGAIGGSLLGVGAGNVLGYAAGGLAGAALGSFTAKGMFD